jgi:hypothetical protein
MVLTDNIARFQTTLSENEGPLRTRLRENETTLFENRPTTSGLDQINANSYSGIRSMMPSRPSSQCEPPMVETLGTQIETKRTSNYENHHTQAPRRTADPVLLCSTIAGSGDIMATCSRGCFRRILYPPSWTPTAPGTRETLRNSGVTESVNFPHFEDHHLKFKPDCDLCAVQCQLIEEAVGAFITEIVIKIPITNLGKDITGDLAA